MAEALVHARCIWYIRQHCIHCTHPRRELHHHIIQQARSRSKKYEKRVRELEAFDAALVQFRFHDFVEVPLTYVLFLLILGVYIMQSTKYVIMDFVGKKRLFVAVFESF